MTKNTQFIGSALILLGVGFYAMTGAKTALIPSVLGVVLVLCGQIGQRKPSWRKHAMHAAAGVAALGALATLGRALPALFGRGGSLMATIEQFFAAGLCLVLVAQAAQSFAEARSGEAGVLA